MLFKFNIIYLYIRIFVCLVATLNYCFVIVPFVYLLFPFPEYSRDWFRSYSGFTLIVIDHHSGSVSSRLLSVNMIIATGQLFSTIFNSTVNSNCWVNLPRFKRDRLVRKKINHFSIAVLIILFNNKVIFMINLNYKDYLTRSVTNSNRISVTFEDVNSFSVFKEVRFRFILRYDETLLNRQARYFRDHISADRQVRADIRRTLSGNDHHVDEQIANAYIYSYLKAWMFCYACYVDELTENGSHRFENNSFMITGHKTLILQFLSRRLEYSIQGGNLIVGKSMTIDSSLVDKVKSHPVYQESYSDDYNELHNTTYERILRVLYDKYADTYAVSDTLNVRSGLHPSTCPLGNTSYYRDDANSEYVVSVTDHRILNDIPSRFWGIANFVYLDYIPNFFNSVDSNFYYQSKDKLDFKCAFAMVQSNVGIVFNNYEINHPETKDPGDGGPINQGPTGPSPLSPDEDNSEPVAPRNPSSSGSSRKKPKFNKPRTTSRLSMTVNDNNNYSASSKYVGKAIKSVLSNQELIHNIAYGLSVVKDLLTLRMDRSLKKEELELIENMYFDSISRKKVNEGSDFGFYSFNKYKHTERYEPIEYNDRIIKNNNERRYIEPRSRR